MLSSRMNQVRVLLADDQATILSGLRYVLEQGDRLTVVGESKSGREAIRMTGELRPDVVFMDITMPDMNGIDATREIKTRYPFVRVLVVSTHSDDEYVMGALEAGADGYLLKRCHPQELRAAVLQVHAGERVIDQSVVHALVNRNSRRMGNPLRDPLSDRELGVLQLLAEGSTSKEIAADLGLRPKTVENHRARILDKLGVANSAAAVRIAIAEGLVASGDGKKTA